MHDFFFVFVSTKGCFSPSVTISLDLQHKNKVYEVVIWVCFVVYPLGFSSFKKKIKKGRKNMRGSFHFIQLK